MLNFMKILKSAMQYELGVTLGLSSFTYLPIKTDQDLCTLSWKSLLLINEVLFILQIYSSKAVKQLSK